MVANLLAGYLDQGTGTRLPPERQLSEELGVSRSEIRKALAQLESEGRLSREVGRGTFVRAAPGEPTLESDDLQHLTSPRDAMEARLLIEPELASLAAVNSTFRQIDAMRKLAEQMRAAETWSAYEQEDGRLHRLIAEATGNQLLAAVHKTVDDVRRAVVWKLLDRRPSGPPRDYSSFAEHDAIIDAIEQRDRVRAREAMQRHLRTTIEKLIGPES